MRERARLAELRSLRSLARAVRARAQGALVVARATEAQAHRARDDADGQVAAMAIAWTDHLASGAFDPNLSASIGRALRHLSRSAGDARSNADSATTARDAADRHWITQDARCQVGDALIDTARCRVARRVDDRLLDATADRVASQWRQP